MRDEGSDRARRQNLPTDTASSLYAEVYNDLFAGVGRPRLRRTPSGNSTSQPESFAPDTGSVATPLAFRTGDQQPVELAMLNIPRDRLRLDLERPSQQPRHTIREQLTATGARIGYGEGNQILWIERRDGSRVDAYYQGNRMTRLEERQTDGAVRSWSRHADDTWTCAGQATRRNMVLEANANRANGNMRFDTLDGLTHIIRGNGTELITGPGRATYTFDGQGRITSFLLANGRGIRGIGYEDNTENINRLVVNDRRTGGTITYTKQGNTDHWVMTHTDRTGTHTRRIGLARGEARMADDGTYMIRDTRHHRGHHAAANDRWRAWAWNGTEHREAIGTDGSRAIYDAHGHLRGVIRSDVTIDTSFNGTTLNRLAVTNRRTGQRETWTRQQDGSYTSDSARHPEPVHDLTFNTNGEVLFTATDGSRHIVRPDGAEQFVRRDGATVTLDSQGRTRRVSIGNSYREFDYDGNTLVGVSEVVNGGPRHQWRRHRDDNGYTDGWTSSTRSEMRHNIAINNGDLSWSTQNGTQITDRADFSRITRNNRGLITNVTALDGSTRNYDYDQTGELLSITDTSPAGNRPPVITRWHRQRNDSGSLTNSMVLVNAEGQPILDPQGRRQERLDVTVLPDGSFKYRDAHNHWHTERLGMRVGDSGISTSVQEARERFLDSARRAGLNGTKLAQMEQMIAAFETRMADSVERASAARVRSPEQIQQQTEGALVRTYDRLSAMVSDTDPNTFYDQPTRLFLARNFMLYAAQPCNMDQGSSGGAEINGHGTCWEKAPQTWAMAHHPDAMADLLAQVALTGQYTTLNGGSPGSPPRTFSFSRNFLTFRPGLQETRWTISTATDPWTTDGRVMRESDGDRSPVGRIFDYVMPVLGGRPEGDVDGGLYHPYIRRGRLDPGVAAIMYMVTGDQPSERSFENYTGHILPEHRNSEAIALLDHGSIMRYSARHAMSVHLQRITLNGRRQWVLINDNQHGERTDRIIGIIDNLDDFRNRGMAAVRQVDLPVPYQRFFIPNDNAIGAVRPNRPVNAR
jgi:YD repeat-containing protein